MHWQGVIRRLWVFERDRVRDHLFRLDLDRRLLRFGGYASAARIAEYCDRIDWSGAPILGYVAGAMVHGIGELTPIRPGRPRVMEIAVSVERPSQNRGIGRALLRRLVLTARNRLIERIHMICLIENSRAVRMARRLDGVLRFDHGEAEARIEPLWPTPWTRLEKVLFETASPALGAPMLPTALRPGSDPDQVMTVGALRPVRSRSPAS